MLSEERFLTLFTKEEIKNLEIDWQVFQIG